MNGLFIRGWWVPVADIMNSGRSSTLATIPSPPILRTEYACSANQHTARVLIMKPGRVSVSKMLRF